MNTSMKYARRLGLCSALLCASLTTQAAGWSGDGELGVVLARGNTKTDTINTKLNFDRDLKQWHYAVLLTALNTRSLGATTGERYTGELKIRRKLDEQSYVFSNGRYEKDRFSGFAFQTSLVLGYGRTLLKTAKQDLDLELGAGFRRIRDDAPPQNDNDNAVLSGTASYGLDLSETARLGNIFSFESGSDNTYIENESALTMVINGAFSMKLGYTVRRNSSVQAGNKNMDTLTTANLVYHFKK